MKKIIVAIAFLISFTGTFVFFYCKNNRSNVLSPISEVTPVINELPLLKYSFDSLNNRQFTSSELEFGNVASKNDFFTSYLFNFISDGKSVSGLSYIPKSKKPAPVIVMLRGFVEREIYEPGLGTKRAAEEFAKAGFAILSPDFLGYGNSASPSAHPMEERFETYTTVLNLLSSVVNLPKAISNIVPGLIIETEKVGIWGHSNGGHIALSVLSITGKDYPTVLWAPVSKSFPYSILYFTDEYEDHGKKLRKLVADFEADYDIELFSPTNYFDWIDAPMQIHHGLNDDAVPFQWSDQLYKELADENKSVEYYKYPDSNHHLAPSGWQTAVNRSINFYLKNFVRKL